MYKGNVIVKPLITEKTMREAEKSKFSFAVNVGTDKNAIKKVVEQKFGVNVVSITTSRVKGRTKRVGSRRIEVINPAWKKATVELKKGQNIDIFTVGK